MALLSVNADKTSGVNLRHRFCWLIYERVSTPKRLYLLQLSTTNVPLGGDRVLEMLCSCYLIEMSDGQHILINSGFPPDVLPPPQAPRPQNEKNVLQHLSELALNPEEISPVVCTTAMSIMADITIPFSTPNLWCGAGALIWRGAGIHAMPPAPIGITSSNFFQPPVRTAPASRKKSKRPL